MPSTRCVVQDCSNTSDKNAGISLPKSPNDESLRRMICSEHFSTDCFERLFHLNGVTQRLKSGAVPTIWKKSPVQITTRDRHKVSKNMNMY